MLAPPMPVFAPAPKKEFLLQRCTCGAKDFTLRRKQNHARENTHEAKQAANCPAASAASLRRSFWRRLLRKGPRCVCPKRRVSVATTQPGLVAIPAAYADCDTVTVAGRRVPFTLDMQQRRRASWTPLDAIREDE